ncbi:DUF4442 domain-containing protein [Oceanisphaera pacifica]|uniref:DUF4442 domain-containing protein n=1 Tax=Oceanisphaera pacifica TaxID=2818389 RepID=A0ABS3NH90_9GAMM|nr:DUF4442 domain-containing protein [Oceanisphaera pacifica]MBO1519949.1 DUF4442 domain-containing protein [Oceanisphaera pacifica]
MSKTTGNGGDKKYRPPASNFKWISPKVERALNQASMRSPVLRWLLSWIFFPMVCKFGLRINYDPNNFYVEVPHKRFNRNAYGTIGGAALLANIELAAGAYLFMRTDGGHRLVCRNLSYRFRLPSTNGLHFKIEPVSQDIDEAITTGQPFNADLKVHVYTRGKQPGVPGRLIGRGDVTFHLWTVSGASDA